MWRPLFGHLAEEGREAPGRQLDGRILAAVAGGWAGERGLLPVPLVKHADFVPFLFFIFFFYFFFFFVRVTSLSFLESKREASTPPEIDVAWRDPAGRDPRSAGLWSPCRLKASASSLPSRPGFDARRSARRSRRRPPRYP